MAKRTKPAGLAGLKIDLADLDAPALKDVQINFRLSKRERQSILETAEALNMSVSSYITGLHRLALASYSKREK